MSIRTIYAPRFCATNTNVFAYTFGIEFTVEDDIYARPMSAYEYASYLRLDRDLTYFLSHPDNFCLIDFGIPKSTSKLFLGIILNKLDAVNAENFEVSMPRQIAAPAATAMIPTFVNCVIGSRIPDNRVWATALTEDPVTNIDG